MSIDEQTASLLKELNSHDSTSNKASPIANARAGADVLFSKFSGETEKNCWVEDRQVKWSGYTVPVRIYHPNVKNKTDLLPIIVFFHGGGWSLGSVDAYDSFVRSLCSRSEVIYISVDYRLAPEHKFPNGLNDCLAVAEWVLVHGADVGGDISRIAVMGDSAGGNLATVIAHKLSVKKPNQVKAQFLLYPVMDNVRSHSLYKSRMTFGNGEYLLSRDSIDAAIEWYLNSNVDPSDPEISPALQKDLTVLPPTVIIVGGHDPLLDEAKKYHSDLTMAGIKSHLKIYETAIHAFLSFGVLRVAEDARQYLATQVKQLL